MAVWITLLFYGGCLAVGLVLAISRGISLWRQLKRTSAAFGSELERIERATAEIDGHLQRAGASAERLDGARSRLSLSRARLDVQLAALREARTQVGRIFWFVPGR